MILDGKSFKLKVFKFSDNSLSFKGANNMSILKINRLKYLKVQVKQKRGKKEQVLDGTHQNDWQDDRFFSFHIINYMYMILKHQI